MRKVLWGDLTAAELRTLAAGDPIVVLPIGSTEQHGPHLPVQVDSLLVSEVAKRAAERAGDETILVMPTVWTGLAEHHMGFGGTVTLDYAVFYALIRQVCLSLTRQGIRRIALLNGHGGNIIALQLAAGELAREIPGVVATATCPRITRLIRGSLSSPETSASICKAIGHMGSTRPMTPRIRPNSSSAATGSARTSSSPASSRLPIGWPASAPLPPNRCWMMVAHSLPCGLSAARAANAMRRSPGGMMSSSDRSRPDEPPSSATVTTAVTCGVSLRAADSVAYSP